jgi:hypothetical protein
VGAAVVSGGLLVLASQFAAAIVQVDQPVPPSVAGLTPAQASELGLQLHLSLTGWFTFDVLAAFALFVVAIVLGCARWEEIQDSSAGSRPSAPDAFSASSRPWS